jgi:cation diffusion facilitator family transporter
MSGSSKKAVLTALSANAVIAIAKSIGAVFTKSGTLFAEALHSWADCINQVLLLVGMTQSQRKADDNHPMGYGKVGYFYSMCVAFLLFFIAGIASIHHGLEVIQHPEPVKYLGISIGILLLSVALEGYALFSAMKGVREENPEWTTWEWFKKTRNSELLIVVAEDTGALIGLTIALAALSATAITGNPIYDAIGTIAVGVLLIVVAINVMIEVKAMITGESIGLEKEDEIIAYLESQPEVKKVINIITQQYGKDIMVALKVEMNKAGSDVDLVKNIDAVEDRMQKKFNIKWSFFEPDFDKELKNPSVEKESGYIKII